MKHGAHRPVLMVLALCCACQNDQPQHVVFAGSKPMGAWYTDKGASAGTSASGGDKPSDGASDEPGQVLDPVSDGTTTASSADGAGGAAGEDANRVDAGAPMSAAAGGGGGGGVMTPANPIGLSLKFITKVVHLGKLDKNGTCVVPNPTPMLPKSCWGPENAGAVWVETADGHFVKTLEVWAKSRRQNLIKYAAAHGDMPIDVTASASRVKDLTTGEVPNDPHVDMWNGVDRSGKLAPPGKYRIEIELADCDAADDPTCKNAGLEIGFDSSMHGAVMVKDMDFFTNVELTVK